MDTHAKDKFDTDIKKLTIINEISPMTTNISKGEKVGVLYVLHIALKSIDYEEKNIALISKLISQNLIFVLEYDRKARLAVFHTKLQQSDWKPIEELKLELKGLNLDEVWEDIILQVSGITLEPNRTLDEQIKVNDTKLKLKKQIETLEKLARCEKQPKKKFEFAQQIQCMKKELDDITGGNINGQVENA